MWVAAGNGLTFEALLCAYVVIHLKYKCSRSSVLGSPAGGGAAAAAAGLWGGAWPWPANGAALLPLVGGCLACTALVGVPARQAGGSTVKPWSSPRVASPRPGTRCRRMPFCQTAQYRNGGPLSGYQPQDEQGGQQGEGAGQPLTQPDGPAERILPWLKRASAVVVGPGLGDHPHVCRTARALMLQARALGLPLLVDGSALTHIVARVRFGGGRSTRGVHVAGGRGPLAVTCACGSLLTVPQARMALTRPCLCPPERTTCITCAHDTSHMREVRWRAWHMLGPTKQRPHPAHSTPPPLGTPCAHGTRPPPGRNPQLLMEVGVGHMAVSPVQPAFCVYHHASWPARPPVRFPCGRTHLSWPATARAC